MFKLTISRSIRCCVFLWAIIFLFFIFNVFLVGSSGRGGWRRRTPSSSNKMIYIITPTYRRYTQKADLTRLSYTLMHVPGILWIVVEDATETSALVAGVLNRSGVGYQLLAAKTPEKYKLKDPTAVKNWQYPRGVAQRNKALKWLRDTLPPNSQGVLYFADDDNTYDLRLFTEMRSTKVVSVWPVAFVGEMLVERPVVVNGVVVDFVAAYDRRRPFPLDMAGFAVNIQLVLKNADLYFDYGIPRGYQESHFLQPLVTREQLEPKAANCTQVLVWHTRTMNPALYMEKRLQDKGIFSAASIEI